MTLSDNSLRWAWPAALGCFVLAGATGSLLRFGMLYGYPAGLQMADVRHAHSHLMYFGWATPALMALMATYLPKLTGRERPVGFPAVIGATFVAGLLAYGPFLLFGYRPVTVAGAQVPLSMIGAGLNMVVWYGFVVLYVRATRGAPRHHPLRLWDAALGFLVLASLGAWGLAGSTLLGLRDPLWSLALTHLFLDLFADGWFVLALLGLAYAAHPRAAAHPAAGWGENLLVIGLPLTFALSLPAGALPPGVRVLAGIAGALVAAGLAANLWALWPAVRRQGRKVWLAPLFFLGLKAIAELGISFPAGAQWASRMALRVSYLHWLLLGFVTLGLVAAAAGPWGRRATVGRRAFTAAALLLLLSLIPLTHLWPAGWGGRWALVTASWATVGPVVAAGVMLAGSVRGGRTTQPVRSSQPQLQQVE
ncbi:MAG: hypothetical protein R3248_04515 [Candidatus Promineifilaceae bacterium]|nr:hypothetical protein [Candidatus Promineifilaceae bacterium]